MDNEEVIAALIAVLARGSYIDPYSQPGPYTVDVPSEVTSIFCHLAQHSDIL